MPIMRIDKDEISKVSVLLHAWDLEKISMGVDNP